MTEKEKRDRGFLYLKLTLSVSQRKIVIFSQAHLIVYGFPYRKRYLSNREVTLSISKYSCFGGCAHMGYLQLCLPGHGQVSLPAQVYPYHSPPLW